VAVALEFLKSRAPVPIMWWATPSGRGGGRALVAGLSADGAIFVAPPIALMDLNFLPEVPKLRLIIVGNRDELCPQEGLQALMASNQPGAGETGAEVLVIEGADHFFANGEEELFQVLRDFPGSSAGLGARPPCIALAGRGEAGRVYNPPLHQLGYAPNPISSITQRYSRWRNPAGRP